MVATTFGTLLDARLRDSPGRPLLTWYDDGTGERTELSVTTYANWVAKTAGVLTDVLDLEPGDRVRVDLPNHWLGPVFLGATWLAGLEVRTPASAAEVEADLVVQGPGGSTIPAHQRLGCALLPFAVSAPGALDGDVVDFGTLWPGQPDAFLGVPAAGSDLALDGVDQATMLDRARGLGYAVGERVLTDLNPVTTAGLDVFVGALAMGGSVVLLAHPDPGLWAGRADTERVTREVRG